MKTRKKRVFLEPGDCLLDTAVGTDSWTCYVVTDITHASSNSTQLANTQITFMRWSPLLGWGGATYYDYDYDGSMPGSRSISWWKNLKFRLL